MTKKLTALALAAGALLATGTARAQENDYARMLSIADKARDRRTEATKKLVAAWPSAEVAAAAPLQAPARYPLAPTYVGERIAEPQRQIIERRARAAVDYVLSMPSLRGTGVSIRLAPQITSAQNNRDWAPAAILNFTVVAGGAEAPFQVELGINAENMYDQRNVGSSPGGCQRWQYTWPGARYAKNGKEGTERLMMRIEKGYPPITGVRITPMFKPDPGDAGPPLDPASAQGRATAAIFGLSCSKLLAAANGAKGEEADF